VVGKEFGRWPFQLSQIGTSLFLDVCEQGFRFTTITSSYYIHYTVQTMAKVKAAKGANCPNKSLHSRVSFLYQAASYLSSRQLQNPDGDKAESLAEKKEPEICAIKPKNVPHDFTSLSSHALSRQYLSDLRSVSLKTLIRLSPKMKHTICKRCDTMMTEGFTCTINIENKSKNGKKPWADVLVQSCHTCGFERRFPISAERQKRRPHRELRIVDAQAG
jgi:ribonuclease P protein subunit RPR2